MRSIYVAILLFQILATTSKANQTLFVPTSNPSLCQRVLARLGLDNAFPTTFERLDNFETTGLPQAKQYIGKNIRLIGLSDRQDFRSGEFLGYRSTIPGALPIIVKHNNIGTLKASYSSNEWIGKQEIYISQDGKEAVSGFSGTKSSIDVEGRLVAVEPFYYRRPKSLGLYQGLKMTIEDGGDTKVIELRSRGNSFLIGMAD